MTSKTNYYDQDICVRYYPSYWYHKSFEWTINRRTILKLVNFVTTSPMLPYCENNNLVEKKSDNLVKRSPFLVVLFLVMTIRRCVISMALCVSICSDLVMHRRIQHGRAESSRRDRHGTGRQPVVFMFVHPRVLQRNRRTYQRYARQSSVGRPL